MPKAKKTAEPQPSASVASGLGILVQIAFVALAAVGVYSFVSVTRDGETRRVCSAQCALKPEYMGASRRVPTFMLKDLEGKDVSLSAFEGKVVLLNFWTKTCGPCLEEMPEVAELTKILASRQDVAVVTISTDESIDDVRTTLKTVLKGDAPFYVLHDPENSVVRAKFGTKLFPETWLIDKNGVIRARFDGAKAWTNPLMIDFIDRVRAGDFCNVETVVDKKSGGMEIQGRDQHVKMCKSIGG